MFKGFIKNTFGFVLSVAPVVVFLQSSIVVVENSPAKRNFVKNKFLTRYTASQEFKEIKEELPENKIIYVDNKGTNKTVSVTEEFVVEYGSEDAKQKLSAINAKIAEMEEKFKTGAIITAVSCTLAAPITLKGMKFFTLGDSKLEPLSDEENEYYMNKEVII